MTHSLAVKYGLDGADAAPAFALTGLYDLICLNLPADVRSQSLQEELCAGMRDWRSAEHYRPFELAA